MGHLLRFSAVLGAGCAGEARRNALNAFHQIRLVARVPCPQLPRETDIFIESVDQRGVVAMEIQAIEWAPGQFFMRLKGPLDSQTAITVDSEAYELQKLGGKILVIDLDRVTKTSSAGLGTLLNLNDRFQLTLVRLPAEIRQMIHVLGLEVALACFDTVAEALKPNPPGG